MSELRSQVLDNCEPDLWYAVWTVQLGELIEKGIFDWTRPELDWSAAAFDQAQFDRVCSYFCERFYWREISIEPFAQWAQTLRRKLVFELMPKYKPLYERISEGINPISSSNEYYKSRVINSEYPETLLSGNSDYVSHGTDQEYQKVVEGDFITAVDKFAKVFKSVDEMLLDELKSMFISIYTLNSNTSW